MIKRRKRLTEPEAAYFLQQLIEAVRYMHDAQVIHRDLKLGNLFLDRDMQIKVGDLGLATRVEDRDEKRKTICGTPNYIAPEIIQGDKAKRGHSFEVDIWSMGVVLYTILIGKPPYEAKDVRSTYQRILANEYCFPEHVNLSSNARNLIESMLKSDPNDRPSLDFIESHPFLTSSPFPVSLPNSVVHRTPVWRVDDFGSLVMEDDRAMSVPTQPALTKSSSQRQPFASRHPNMNQKTVSSIGTDKSEREPINLRRVVNTAMNLASGAAKRATETAGFQIYDDSKVSNKREEADDRQTSIGALETITTRTRALSIAAEPPTVTQASSPYAAASVTPSESTTKSSEKDADILRKMADQIDVVLAASARRSGQRYAARPVSPRYGPSKWITRYVDYKSKYGLGFLLNDGGSGVYFNDSTKTAIGKHGDTFQYIERKREEKSSVLRRPETIVETYSLSCYPDELTKKVTLLTHFRNYLIEQQKKAEAEEGRLDEDTGPSDDDNDELVYVKKWTETRHAIFFRLSNHTIQVVFYDQTEVLMTTDTRFVTYVDKNRLRATYNLTDELIGTSTELEKRLKYTKEIIHQMVSGQRR